MPLCLSGYLPGDMIQDKKRTLYTAHSYECHIKSPKYLTRRNARDIPRGMRGVSSLQNGEKTGRELLASKTN
jgi:hypothetical protein